MTEPYSDEECRYLGGDPRLEETGAAVVEILAGCIRLQLRQSSHQDDVLRIPKAAIQGVRATEERVGMEQAEYEENVILGPHETLTRHIVIVDVNDPEGVQEAGLPVRIAFRNEYFAKVFEKRCREAYNLAPF